MARTTWLLAPLLGTALAAGAQTLPDVEIGYRWLSLHGSSDVYRSQINERSGLLLRSFTYNTTDNLLGDHLRIDATDLGVGPAGALRIESGRSGSYRFNLRYRRADAFSAIPTFALGQHTFDRTRSSIDADFELLRWSKFTPFAGISWNSYEGPGTTTYHAGQDEFLLQQSLHDTDRELRIGTGFDLGMVQGEVTQGWRRFRGRETLTLAPGAGNGNNSDPVLGKPIDLTQFTREDHTDTDAPFTSFYATGMAGSRVRLVGQYTRFNADSSGNESEDLTGSLASFALARFFAGLSEQSSARAKNDTWRADARAEVELVKGVELIGGWQRESRELSGSALINTLFLQSITFGGADPRDISTVLATSNSLDRTEDNLSVAVSARSVGPFSLRGGFSTSNQDVTVTPDLSEIVVPGGQGGTFHRRVDSFDADASFHQSGFTVGAAWKRSHADDPILRTDFLHRDRVRVRAAWQAPKFVRAGISADETRQSNDRPDTDYDAKVREYSGDLEVTPAETLSFRATASRFRSDSRALFRLPQNFTTGDSINVEHGTSVGGGMSLFLPRVTFDGDFSRFTNHGTLPFTLSRMRARVTVPVRAQFGIAGEWAKDRFRDDTLDLSSYRGSRFGVFVRYTP